MGGVGVAATVRTLAGLELVGNALCLDFANTLNSRHRTEHDYVASYPELLSWSEYAGGLDARAAALLRSHSDGPAASAAASALARTHRLRTTIYRVFSPVAHGRAPEPADIDDLSGAFAAAMGHATIQAQRTADPGRTGGFALGWPAAGQGDLEAPLWPVAHSAGHLLLTGDLERIGECPGCGWLFLDTSRNGARRWCSMATCGSRDKMARYHVRQRNRGVS